MKIHFRSLSLAIGIAVFPVSQIRAATIVNGSFETGNLSGWQFADLSNPYDRLVSKPGGLRTAFGGFTSGQNIEIPTQGSYAMVNGFSGTAGTIRLFQDVGVAAPGDQLKFDYRIGFDMADFGATQDRLFNVVIEPAGGGAALGTFLQ